MSWPFSLTGCHYLVTGASSGIGRATAVHLSAAGARVAITGRDAARLEQTMTQLVGTGHSSHPFELQRVTEIAHWLADIASLHGKLNGIVHAAGVQSMAALQMVEFDRTRDMWAVNVEAALALSKGFRSRAVYAGEKGAVVFISSVMGLVGMPARSAYSATKGALNGMARSLAMELAPQGIRVNCVAPAFVRTEMFEEAQRLWTVEQRKAVESAHPLGIGTPEDVANAVHFLVAESGRWITGSVLVVDGGYTAR